MVRYYYYISTLDRPDKDADLNPALQRSHHEHKGRYGYRRITAEVHNLLDLFNGEVITYAVESRPIY
ncbi:hypothetical protein CBW46_016290 [Paenibacillus xerothermodurans]|uniref:HTH-like domain-containing protein n=1 Tax=Paenibacillus xerothermodurans TaxID=1977292 RepID=A0A2W1NW09_PAEXE|nr:hypothetical protein CBW46_016290 [Paenibacillus xerothermodurans]